MLFRLMKDLLKINKNNKNDDYEKLKLITEDNKTLVNIEKKPILCIRCIRGTCVHLSK